MSLPPNMASDSTLGRFSIAGGALAVVLALTARYAASIYVADDWFVTEFIQRHHLWRPGDGKLEAKATTIFTLTELNAITWCYTASVVFSVLAIASSFAAEVANEDSLLHAAGHILGAMAFVVINWTWGLPTLMATTIAILVFRRVRKEA